MNIIQRIINAMLVTQPPHPLFVHFPIALISAALFFILVAIWRKNDLFEKIAFANVSLAAVSTIFAEIFGIWDNIARWQNAAPNYVAKIVIASILLVLTGAVAIWRWRKPDLFHSGARGLYIASYAAGFLLVGVQGFLGAIIVYGF